MGIENPNIDVIHRIGKIKTVYGNKPKPRNVIIRFRFLNARNVVWSTRAQLKDVKRDGNNLWLSEDLPLPVKLESDKMRRIYWVTKNHGEHNDVRLRGNTFYLDGRPYTKNNLHNLPKWLRRSEIATLEGQHSMVFYTAESPFSNHHKATVTIDGQSYTTMEKIHHQTEVQGGKTP